MPDENTEPTEPQENGQTPEPQDQPADAADAQEPQPEPDDAAQPQQPQPDAASQPDAEEPAQPRRNPWIGIVGGAIAAILVVCVLYVLRSSRQDKVLVDFIQKIKAEGDALVEQGRYDLARQSYEEAMEHAEKLSDKNKAIKDAVKAALESDDIKYGDDPLYEKFEGKWISKMDKDALLEKRVEAQQKAKGLVKYKYKWVTPAERDRLKKKDKAEQDLMYQGAPGM